MDERERMIKALTILSAFNPMRNDTDAYLYEIVRWALGLRYDEPSRSEFGLD